ncbi:MAG TPA: hypothetical protein V6D17_20310 [Candidatus Obscuribacterales bacterium]
MNKLLKRSSSVLALATIALAGQASLAQTTTSTATTVTESTSTAPSVTTTTSGTVPFVMVQEGGTPSIIQAEVSVKPVPYVTRAGRLTAITVYTPDDLITRRDDLLARIAVMESRGQLTSTQASALIARVNSIDAARPVPVRKDSTAYYKQVKSLYKAFDKVANDIRDMSGHGDRQVAGTYSYIVF